MRVHKMGKDGRFELESPLWRCGANHTRLRQEVPGSPESPHLRSAGNTSLILGRFARSAEILLEAPRSETTKSNRESGLIADLVKQHAWRAKPRVRSLKGRRRPNGLLRARFENFGQGDGRARHSEQN
jgi:hypothetical protein